MMGNTPRSGSLSYCFRLEDLVPENHLLRLIDRHIRFTFVRKKLKDFYSENGRPSIDPDLLFCILLIGYLYGITSERRLVEELRMHLALRWFTGLGVYQEIPHHSTFSKNRHGRFFESGVLEQPMRGSKPASNSSIDNLIDFFNKHTSKQQLLPANTVCEWSICVQQHCETQALSIYV
jgi:transposase